MGLEKTKNYLEECEEIAAAENARETRRELMHAGRDLLVIPAEFDINYIVIYSNIPRVSL